MTQSLTLLILCKLERHLNMPVVICYLIVLHLGFEIWEDECASDGMLPGTRRDAA